MLMLGVIFSSIGLGYFMYGKKRQDMVIRYTGLALMVYPYFVGNTIMLIAVGVALMAVPKFIKL